MMMPGSPDDERFLFFDPDKSDDESDEPPRSIAPKELDVDKPGKKTRPRSKRGGKKQRGKLERLRMQRRLGKGNGLRF